MISPCVPAAHSLDFQKISVSSLRQAVYGLQISVFRIWICRISVFGFRERKSRVLQIGMRLESVLGESLDVARESDAVPSRRKVRVAEDLESRVADGRDGRRPSAVDRPTGSDDNDDDDEGDE